jgi:peptidylprolyl isomerase
MKNLLFAFFLVIMTITSVSCLKDDDDSEKRAKEKRLIENYIQTNNISATPSSSGLYYVPVKEGTGATPTDNDYALITYKITNLEGKFFDGTDKALVEKYKVYPYFYLGGPLKIYAGPQGFYPGVIEGLRLMKEGGKARLIMPSLLAYNDYDPKIIEVELLEVISDPMAYEKRQIANFLDTATNNTVTPADSVNGIYYIEKTAGTGAAPEAGKTVTLKYKGYLPDGRVFDKTEIDKTFSFIVGEGKVIKGFDSGVRLMKKGGKATIVIPYYWGYGFKAYAPQTQVAIPMFSTLVFDLELIDIVN